MNLSPLARIELAEKAHAEGRIIQGSWRRNAGGHELVCALAAFGPDINSAGDCPADLMPHWLASLVPTLDDGIAKNEVPWFSGELISRARRWHVLDDAAWDRIRTGFMIAGIKQALASAEPVQPDPKPAYWQEVVDACNGVIAALETGRGLSAAARWAAAAAAEAAAARWAAAAAARWASAAAAEAAAAEAAAARWAAAAAARWAAAAAAEAAAAEAAAAEAAAARWAAAAAAAAAARETAYKTLAETLFKIIDVELASAESTASK
jgi:hypothetical protein